jgi:hypothetical protein
MALLDIDTRAGGTAAIQQSGARAGPAPAPVQSAAAHFLSR